MKKSDYKQIIYITIGLIIAEIFKFIIFSFVN